MSKGDLVVQYAPLNNIVVVDAFSRYAYSVYKALKTASLHGRAEAKEEKNNYSGENKRRANGRLYVPQARNSSRRKILDGLFDASFHG